MLTQDPGAVLEIRPEMKIAVDDGPHRSLYVHQLGEQEDDGIQVLVVVEVAAGENQVSDARAAKIETVRHGVQEVSQLVADEAAHGIGDLRHRRVLAPDEVLEGFPKVGLAAVAGKPVIEQLVDFRMPGDALVGQRHEPAAQVADGWHGEGLPQLRRTAA